MKKLLVVLLLFFQLFFAFSQKPRSIYVKANAVFLPIAIVNAGLEYQLSAKYTLQADFFCSPWKSFAGKHAQIYAGHLEGRYYFKEAFQKWYVGINAGTGVFDITKWNYFHSQKYQRGFNMMFGATVGYQYCWKERWNIDFFVGAGTVQSFYHGYEYIPPSLFRYDGAEKWNKSGEFLPYRGGIMIAYKLQ